MTNSELCQALPSIFMMTFDEAFEGTIITIMCSIWLRACIIMIRTGGQELRQQQNIPTQTVMGQRRGDRFLRQWDCCSS